MYKTLPPSSKSWIDMSEYFIIPHLPYIPPSCENHLSKKRLSKLSSGHGGHSHHIITLGPINLEKGPDSVGKQTLEEEVISGFQCVGSAQNTLRSIINVTVSSNDHIFSVDSVHDDQPGKSLDLQSTT